MAKSVGLTKEVTDAVRAIVPRVFSERSLSSYLQTHHCIAAFHILDDYDPMEKYIHRILNHTLYMPVIILSAHHLFHSSIYFHEQYVLNIYSAIDKIHHDVLQ